MNCREAQRQLATSVETGEPRSAALESHFADCRAEDCRRAWRDDRLLARAIRGWRGGAPPVDLAAAVLEALQHSSPAPQTLAAASFRAPAATPGTRARRSAWGPLTAAGLLLAAMAWGLGASGKRDSESSTVADRSGPRPGASSSPGAGASTPVLETRPPRRISQTYVAVAEAPPKLVAECLVAVVPGLRGGESRLVRPESGDMPSMRGLRPMPSSPAGGLWKSLEPAQREFDAALMYLEQALPMGIMGTST